MQTKGLKRNIVDKFYTKPEIVDTCMNFLEKNLNFNTEDTIIEPSAGSGNFINRIKNLANNYHFYDILPEHNEIELQDYLNLNTNIFNKNNKIHVIGNPPFGRQASLAIKFIKKSCEYSDTISFIIPKSFKKDSMKKHFNEYFHLVNELELPKNSFTINKTSYDVPCVFQIWEKRNFKRQQLIKNEPTGFVFVSKQDNPDLAFTRVGGNAGNISKDAKSKSEASHYFIKINKSINIDILISKLKEIKFPTDNTTGPKSISKQELIPYYNKIIESLKP